MQIWKKILFLFFFLKCYLIFYMPWRFLDSRMELVLGIILFAVFVDQIENTSHKQLFDDPKIPDLFLLLDKRVKYFVCVIIYTRKLHVLNIYLFSFGWRRGLTGFCCFLFFCNRKQFAFWTQGMASFLFPSHVMRWF